MRALSALSRGEDTQHARVSPRDGPALRATATAQSQAEGDAFPSVSRGVQCAASETLTIHVLRCIRSGYMSEPRLLLRTSCRHSITGPSSGPRCRRGQPQVASGQVFDSRTDLLSGLTSGLHVGPLLPSVFVLPTPLFVCVTCRLTFLFRLVHG